MHKPTTVPSSALFQKPAPEYVAVILASSIGGRLFPLTSAANPKHNLPVLGVPVVARLLSNVGASGFQECVVVVASDDTVTIPMLKKQFASDDENTDTSNSNSKGSRQHQMRLQLSATKPNLVMESPSFKVTLFQLQDECSGNVEALRRMEESSIVPASSNLMVIPGDLVVLDTSVFCNLCDTHRRGQESSSENGGISTACTILLADVGEQDEHGVPLKESAKQKKGGVARDEEEIEYIALSYGSSPNSSSPRLVWKQLKIDVHDNEDMVATTPKLILPKPRLRLGRTTRVRTDWSDRHVYIFAPWVRRLLVARKSLLTIQGDLIPLLVSRQFQGVEATFGSQVNAQVVNEVFLTSADLVALAESNNLIEGREGLPSSNRPSSEQESPLDLLKKKLKEYYVLAHVQDDAMRAHTIASYLYVCREALNLVSAAPPAKSSCCVQLPPETSLRSKFCSILLRGTTTGDKVTFKSVTVGRRCRVGAKCRLNNVVIMDDVTLGDNVVLQNSIIGSGCTIGNNCSLNDCQVAPGKELPAGEKAKGESYS